MKKLIVIIVAGINCLSQLSTGFCQSPSFKTYMNPVIPGDHSDCTLTQIGNDFYTTGSSFNPTPIIYHSTDLIHWEAIAQPVSASWSNYGDAPAGGCWGGQIVYYNNKYWDFFGRAFVMYFVTADKPEGPWSTPTLMICPGSVPGLGADNSIFIDSDSTWYLLVKNGQVNNWIVQLGKNGQPSGAIYNLTWLNPSPGYPYSWAEGPVMWKHNGYYYYSFARDVSGGQKVMRSTIITGNQSSWTVPVDFFNETDPGKSKSLFQRPNHSSAAVMLNDSTSWVMHPVWSRGISDEWYGQGRQGLVNQVHYDTANKVVADYPVNAPKNAPNLPSSGIPWMVPKSDFFTSDTLKPEWSFLGYTSTATYSLSKHPGWLRLKPKSKTKANTVIKTDAEHNYSLITRLDFNAKTTADEAGIRIMNGLEALSAKIYSSFNSAGHKVICFSFSNTYFEKDNNIGNTLWLKMVRVNHILSGYFSSNGFDWIQVGKEINIASLDGVQSNYNGWCGNRQGLYVQGDSADFDLYIYRDAYTPILAECPANQYGTIRTTPSQGISQLDSIHNNDWALYAGVEFGNKEYGRAADSIQIIASSATSGGSVEVWLDSIDTGNKIGICNISSTGAWSTFNTFSAKVNQVTGRHDVYLKFVGSPTGKLFQLQWVRFISKNAPQYISSATTSDSTIEIKLDKPVIAPALPTGFVITLNGNENDSITQAILNFSDSSLIRVTLKKNIVNTDTIKISYINGNIKSYDSLELISFTDTIVNNLLTGSAPRIIKAQSTLNGDSVVVKFNKKMKSPASYASEFKITKNSLDNPINSVNLENDDSSSFIFIPSQKIYYENINTLDYSGTDVKSIDEGVVKKVTSLPITNLSLGYPLLLNLAAMRKVGYLYSIIVLKFDRILGDVSDQKDFFTITINGTSVTIKSITGSSDSIRFSIYPYVKYGDTVKVSYSGGTVESLHKGKLSYFTDYLVPNTIPTSLKSPEIQPGIVISVYPNPLSRELNIYSEFEFNTLSIYNMAGMLILEKRYGKKVKEVTLYPDLAKGTYLLKLTGNSSSAYSKIVVL